MSTQKKEMDPVIKIFTFVMLMLGVLANNLIIKIFIVTVVLCVLSVESYMREIENQQYRKHCVI